MNKWRNRRRRRSFKQNSYEEIRKLVEDGGEMRLKKTTNTNKDNNKNASKIKCNYLIKIIIKNNNYLVLFI